MWVTFQIVLRLSILGQKKKRKTPPFGTPALLSVDTILLSYLSVAIYFLLHPFPPLTNSLYLFLSLWFTFSRMLSDILLKTPL